MLDRFGKIARRFSRARQTHQSNPPPIADTWRFDPLAWENLWSRAAVIHFPSEGAFLSGRAVRRPPGIGRKAALNMGPTGDFQGYRIYEPGDDPRQIDWRATARTHVPIVRQRQIESRRPVAIVIDVSASLWVEPNASPLAARPIDMAFETAVWLAAAALARQSPVSLALISNAVELVIPAFEGRHAIGRVVTSLKEFRPEHALTDWSSIAGLSRPFSTGSLVFWISDYTWLPDPLAFRSMTSTWPLLGIRVAGDQAESFRLGAMIEDVETGRLVEPSDSFASHAIAARARQWADLTGMPLFEMPSNAARPELLLAEWLRRPLFRSGANR